MLGLLAVRRLSLVVESGSYSLLRWTGVSLQGLLLLWSMSFRAHGLKVVLQGLSCPAVCGILVPRLGIEPVSPAKQKQYPAVDVTGDRSKVQCCKEQYCIGTWNVRSMNQGKLEVVKQEMARVNIDILGISELKWTGMGEFNSDDHYIYYCGQESLRRNGVAIMVNKRV